MAGITTAMKNTYNMNFTLLEQQVGSKLQDAVRREMIEGEYKYFDFIDAADATEVFTRNADTVNEDLTYTRRRISLRRFTFAPLIDTFDKLALINDPTSDIVQDALNAMGRQKDKLLVDAAYGTTYGGYDGTTSYTFDTVNNRIAVGSPAAGLTIAKLRSAKAILDGHNVDPAIPRYIACTTNQISDLLNTTQATSIDYNSVKALVDGNVNSFLGFKFIQVDGLVAGSNIIPVDGSSYRRVLCWAEEGLMLGVGKEPKTDIQQRVDKNYSYQVFNEMWLGAMRTSEKKCVEILCSEA